MIAQDRVEHPASESPVADKLAEFALGVNSSDLSDETRDRAKLLILDIVGVALAATHDPFCGRMRQGIDALAAMDGNEGHISVIGSDRKLPLRDALVMNAALMHGLDFDDTHIESIVHPSCISLPMALTLGEQLDASGEDVLLAYVCAMEVATRVGWAAKGGFHHRGLHATGVVGHFSAAVGAGRMLGLNAAQLAAAQGIVVSTAAANQEFLQGGGWNKRLHPGWGAVAGLTAAQLAKHGFLAPRLPYEGKLGLYRTLVGTDPGDFDISLITDGLGTRWETENVAVKPIPACHATHSPADCAVRLVREHGIDPDEIEKVVVRLQQNALNIVAFPEDAKRRPKDDYEAKFSVQYVVAAALHRQKFGLAELSPDALRDQSILATATKVECELDPMPALPGAIPGGVRIHMRSGEIFDQYEAVNRGGADRAMSGSDIVDKYHDNANPVVGSARASALRDLLLNLEKSNAKQVMSALAC